MGGLLADAAEEETPVGHAPDGIDDFSEPVVLAGDRLRVKMTLAGGTVAGRLYVWAKN